MYYDSHNTMVSEATADLGTGWWERQVKTPYTLLFTLIVHYFFLNK